MKKIICILFLVLLSCSKDDPETVDNTVYSVSIQKTCPGGIQTNYIISKNTYDRIKTELTVGDVCSMINFKDLSLKSYSGYFRALTAIK
jgi:hypothetical protein